MAINLGINAIKELNLGNSKIRKAYLGNTKIYDILPYDAEVEYLQSSGTQYIDTGIYGNPQTASEVRFNADTGSPSTLFGCYFSTNERSLTISVGNNVAQRFHNTVCNATVPFDSDTTVLTNKNGVTVNGVFTSRETPSSFTTNYTLYLFRINGSTVTTYFKGKYYYCKIWDDGTLVRDFIPVRVGNVGYMYDKISGQLFGNSGTGDFILGPDI